MFGMQYVKFSDMLPNPKTSKIRQDIVLQRERAKCSTVKYPDMVSANKGNGGGKSGGEENIH